MKKYFDNKKKIILSLIYSVLIIFCGTTFARWIWESTEGQRTDVAFLIEDHEGGYSCSADGGGEIIANEAIIMPASCTSSENVIMREITTDVEIEKRDIEVTMDLWLNVNDIGMPLTETTNFKYVVTDSSTSCTTGIISTGNFNGKTSGSKVNLLNDKFINSGSKKIYLYIWLDEEETNINTANQNFNLSLGGSCTGVSLDVSAPILDDGMIPVVISDDGVVTTIDESDENWYNYSEKKWANMVLVNENSTNSVEGSKSREYYLSNPGTTVIESDILAYYVWIPRYKYKIWTTDANTTTEPQTIDIIFEDKNDEFSNGTTVGSYRTHPSFWWDINSDSNMEQNEMLPGIWVGKFETGGDADTPKVKPNTTSLVNQNVSTQFQTSLKFAGGLMNTSTGDVTFNGNNTYGLTADTDSHMMKNSEWGAVAYLSHSRYGINGEVRINNFYNNGTLTGCGALTSDEAESTTCGIPYGDALEYPQSTTGNITGVYDMSGGSWEYVMGNYSNMSGSSGFSVFPKKKYYDLFLNSQFNSDDTTNMTLCTLETCGGQALYETARWYQDYASLNSVDYLWLNRGGRWNGKVAAGVFSSANATGTGSSTNSFRSVLIPFDYIDVTFDANGGILPYIEIEEPILYNTYMTSGQYTFNVPLSGEYKLETWGAQGGTSTVRGGYGSYTSGKIDLYKDEKIYVYVGENYNDKKESYSYNGGGSGTVSTVATSYGTNGGGASDIRYFYDYTPSENDLIWNSEIGLNSRIMSAAGGGGSNSYYEVIGGNGGGLTGYSGNYVNKGSNSIVVPTGGTQISGGNGTNSNSSLPFMGKFGAGGYYTPYSSSYNYAGGGGGGYYGGGAGGAGSSIVASAAGGSSYISGHTGCVAIKSIDDSTPKSNCTTGTSDNSCSIHYSNKIFKETVMIDGSGYSWSNSKNGLTQMPNPSGGSYSSGLGHTGNGAARITLIRNIDDSRKFLFDYLYGELLVPTRVGYIFSGWYTEAEGGTLISEDTIVSGDINKLYAHWDLAPVYTISYNANGGSGAPGEQEKLYGGTLTLSSTEPTRDGYVFAGWSTSSTATSATYSAGGSYTANESAILYAVWKKLITITYNANGGSGTMANTTFAYGSEPITLPANTYTNSGRTFLSWHIYSPSDDKWFGCTDNSVQCTGSAGNTTLGWHSLSQIKLYYESKPGWGWSSINSENDLVFYAQWSSLLYIYNQGTYLSSVGSSWSGGTPSYQNGSSVVTLTQSGSVNRGGASVISKKVDLTGFSKLTFNIYEYSASGGSEDYNNGFVGVFSTFTGSNSYTLSKSTYLGSAALSNKTRIVDVSSLSGSYYIGAYLKSSANQTTRLRISQIYLE